MLRQQCVQAVGVDLDSGHLPLVGHEIERRAVAVNRRLAQIRPQKNGLALYPLLELLLVAV